MEIWVVLVRFVGGNGHEQLLQPNCFRCCRVGGLGISTQGSRSEKREHIGRDEKTHMVFDQRDEGTPLGSYSNG